MNPGDARDHRLPRGRHPLSPEEVEASQRLRLVEAGASLLATRGVAGVTAREIARQAGVSSSTLYKLFGGADDVLTAGAKHAAVSVTRAVRDGCLGEQDDEGKLAACVVAACEWTSQNAARAALLGLAPTVAIAEVAATREQLVGDLAASLAALDRRRGKSSDAGIRSLMVSAAVTMVSERAGTMGIDEARALGLELAELLG